MSSKLGVMPQTIEMREESGFSTTLCCTALKLSFVMVCMHKQMLAKCVQNILNIVWKNHLPREMSCRHVM